MDGSRVATEAAEAAATSADVQRVAGVDGGGSAAALRQEVAALRRDLASARASLVASDSRVAAAEARTVAAEAIKTEASRDLAECKAHAQQVQQQLEATAAALEQLKAKAAAEEAARATVAGEKAGAARGKAEEGEAIAVSRGPHFRDSTILARVAAGSVAGTAVDGVQALLGWLPAPHYTPKGQAWTLIYRGSRDGWQPSDFHAACDGKGPTLVLVLGTGKDDECEFVAGGYAAAPWTSTDWQYVADPESARSVGRGSFLFSLVDAAGHGPVQLRLKDPADGKALQHHGSLGPIFGSSGLIVGADIGKPLNAPANSGAATRFPCPYDATAADSQRCTTFRRAQAPGVHRSYSFTATELEVFALQ